jgi:hypothetical protein
LAGLAPSGRAVVPLGWSLYDFANTIFSFAVVSGAIGLYLVDDDRFGPRDGNVWLSVAIIASVGIVAQAKTRPVSSNIHLAPPVKAGIGITKADIFLAKKSVITASFGCLSQ